ncbi:hypothetical protein [Nitratidesulfovibrio liaohensis]|uniref:Uncharacterized protein n=1 Tax=Nitratidesulfovibrio liaohensis TaxID=2604158 RepID=A0ABY9R2I1_9BACT|nr:hypothetical protein [Nitratidesulfovibrio liaohensis]EGY23897.1 hypothetical protein DA2_3902 [Desulfovibrio sp. A2]WMW65963.1 hypothetical protein KPS_000499 [Nitratidesulfovibrio liaohensis]
MSEPTTTTTQRMTVEQAADHLMACLFAGSTPPHSMTALEAIRHHCVHDCMGGDRRAVEECADAGCPLHPYRFGRRATTCPHRPTPAIRSFCLYRCMGGDAEAVVGCELSPEVDPRYSPCHLYSFRCGCNPNYAAATAGRS